MTFEVATITFSEIEIVSIQFVESIVTKFERIDMRAVLLTNSMWLVLEGFDSGYVPTEASVDRLHVILHDTIQSESAVIELHTLVQTELVTLFN